MPRLTDQHAENVRDWLEQHRDQAAARLETLKRSPLAWQVFRVYITENDRLILCDPLDPEHQPQLFTDQPAGADGLFIAADPEQAERLLGPEYPLRVCCKEPGPQPSWQRLLREARKIQQKEGLDTSFLPLQRAIARNPDLYRKLQGEWRRGCKPMFYRSMGWIEAESAAVAHAALLVLDIPDALATTRRWLDGYNLQRRRPELRRAPALKVLKLYEPAIETGVKVRRNVSKGGRSKRDEFRRELQAARQTLAEELWAKKPHLSIRAVAKRIAAQPLVGRWGSSKVGPDAIRRSIRKPPRAKAETKEKPPKAKAGTKATKLPHREKLRHKGK